MAAVGSDGDLARDQLVTIAILLSVAFVVETKLLPLSEM
jgi:hypothetical protein